MQVQGETDAPFEPCRPGWAGEGRHLTNETPGVRCSQSQTLACPILPLSRETPSLHTSMPTWRWRERSRSRASRPISEALEHPLPDLTRLV